MNPHYSHVVKMRSLLKLEVDAILPYVGFGCPKMPFETEYGIYYVRTDSTRLECFKRNPCCVKCGVRGNVFLLQQQKPPRKRVSTHLRFNASIVNCYIKDCPFCLLRKQKPPVTNMMPHLNLFHRTKRGKMILMTQDHIMPKSRGGGNDISNLQTMCTKCNNRKGNALPGEKWQGGKQYG